MTSMQDLVAELEYFKTWTTNPADIEKLESLSWQAFVKRRLRQIRRTNPLVPGYIKSQKQKKKQATAIRRRMRMAPPESSFVFRTLRPQLTRKASRGRCASAREAERAQPVEAPWLKAHPPMPRRSVPNDVTDNDLIGRTIRRDVPNLTLTPGKRYLVTCRVKLVDETEHYSTVSQSIRVSANQPMRALRELLYDDIVALITEYHGNYYEATPVQWANVAVKSLDDNKTFINLALKGESLAMKLIGHFETTQNPGECVIDMLLHETSRSRGFRTYTRKDLTDFFPEYQNGVTIARLKEWVLHPDRHNRVSLIALDPLGYAIDTIQPGYHVDMSLVFYVNNNHVYTITDPDLKRVIAQTKQYDLQQIKYDLKFDSYATYTPQEDQESVDQVELLVDGTYSQEKVILIECDDLVSLLVKIIEKHRLTTNNFLIDDNNHVTVFEHPKSGQFYLAAKDLEVRKAIADKMKQMVRTDAFTFRNQSYCQLALQYFKVNFGEIPKSYYSKELKQIYEDFPIKAVVRCFDRGDTADELSTVDIRRCYTSILINNDCPYNVFTVFDEIVRFEAGMVVDIGEYYVHRGTIAIRPEIVIPGGWLPAVLVKELLQQKVILERDIEYCCKPKQYLARNYFKQFAEEFIKEFPDGAKQSVNALTGYLNKKKISNIRTCITNEFDVVCAIVNKYPDVKITQCGLNYFIRQDVKEPMYGGHIPIYRHIIASGILKLMALYDYVKTPENRIVAINTDSITVAGPLNVSLKRKEYVKTPGEYGCETTKATLIGESRVFPSKSWSMIRWDQRGWQAPSGPEAMFRESGLITGAGGTGKTRLICQICNGITDASVIQADERRAAGLPEPPNPNVLPYDEEKDELGLVAAEAEAKAEAMAKGLTCAAPPSSPHPELRKGKTLVLAYTNKAVGVLRKRGVKNPMTFDSLFADKLNMKSHIERMASYGRIIVDEYSMAPMRFYTILYFVRQRYPNMMINLVGDPNQCKPVEGDKVFYDYITSKAIREITCHYQLHLQYIQGCSRYDKPLYDDLEVLLRDRRLAGEFNAIKGCLPVNICRNNLTRVCINRDCFTTYSKGRHIIESTYGRNPFYGMEGVPSKDTHSKYATRRYFIGMPLLAYDNIVEGSVYNSCRYYLRSMSETEFAVSEGPTGDQLIKLGIDKLYVFDYGYAATVYKYQGDTIDEPYNIYNVKHMSLNELYTALSRSTKKEYIHLNTGDLKARYERDTPPEEATLKNVYKPILVDGLIYKIYDPASPADFYIGSTLKTLEKRFSEHKEKPVSPTMAEFFKTAKQPQIELIEEVKVIVKRRNERNNSELVNLEAQYIKSLQPTLNSRATQRCQESRKKEPVVLKQPSYLNRFKITHDQTRKRYSINWAEPGKKGATAKKHFCYTLCGEAVAMAKAQEFRQSLFDRFYKGTKIDTTATQASQPSE